MNGPGQIAPPGQDLWLRRLIFLYIVLWVVEGALRKWILPQLSTPLLVVRDPVMIGILVLAMTSGRLRFNFFVVSLLVLAVVTILISLTISGTPPLIVLFGVRANFLHLLLIFVMAEVLTAPDVEKIRKGFLWLALPMALIVALQFASDPSARINTGAGGGEGGQIESSRGKIRPPGVFSYNNGLAVFNAIVGAFLINALIDRKKPVSRYIFMSGSASVLMMLALSGSRSAVGQFLLIVFAMGLVFILQPEYLRSSGKVVVVGCLLLLALSFSAVLREGVNVLGDRFGEASGLQESMLGRLLGDLFGSPWRAMGEAKALGAGLGMGTNAAAGMMTGSRGFLLAEGDLSRGILEMGPFLGLLYNSLRFSMAIYFIVKGVEAVRKGVGPSALLMAAGCFFDMISGQLGQPTSLGGVVIAGGLSLACAGEKDVSSGEDAPPATGTEKKQPGRSEYARRLNPQ